MPEPEPAWRSQPVPTELSEEPDESGELHLGQPELVPEEPEPTSADEDDEDDEEEELSAPVRAREGTDAAAQEEAKERSRSAAGPAAAADAAARRAARSDAQRLPPTRTKRRPPSRLRGAPAPRRVAVSPADGAPGPDLARRGRHDPVRSARTESFTIPASDFETVGREIIISVPERQRSTDERKIAMFFDFENIALGVRDSDIGKFDIELVLERLVEKGKIVVKKAYADWSRYQRLQARPSTRRPSS